MENNFPEDIDEFHRSYLVKDGECTVEDEKLTEKRNYRIESDEEDEEESTVDKKSKKDGNDCDSEIGEILRNVFSQNNHIVPS